MAETKKITDDSREKFSSRGGVLFNMAGCGIWLCKVLGFAFIKGE